MLSIVAAYTAVINIVVWQIQPTHDVAVGEPGDKKTGPRPLRGIPATNDVIKPGRCPARYVTPL